MKTTSKARKVLVLVSSIALAGGCIAYASWRNSTPAAPAAAGPGVNAPPAGVNAIPATQLKLADGSSMAHEPVPTAPAAPTVEEDVFLGGSKSMPMPLPRPKPPKPQGP